ncbi:MAG: radical SAM protein [Candidatus Micrarchaeota archaeon]
MHDYKRYKPSHLDMNPSQFYQEFNGFYSEVMYLLTGQPVEYPLKRFQMLMPSEKHKLLDGYALLEKLAITLRRVFAKAHPASSIEAMDTKKTEILKYLGKIQKKSREGLNERNRDKYDYKDAIEKLRTLEKELRRFAATGFFIHPMLELDSPDLGMVVGSINVAETCRCKCDYCSIQAEPSDELMPEELLSELLDSKEIIFSRDVFLSDGEVLLYPTSLSGIIRRLIADYGVQVSFTTAGLLPQNRKTGMKILEGLKTLSGPYIGDLNIFLSFNLINPIAIKNRERYLERIRETVEVLMDVGLHSIYSNVMYPNPRDTRFSPRITQETEKALEDMEQRLGLEYFIRATRRTVSSLYGRASYNYPRDQEPEEIKNYCKTMNVSTPLPRFRIRANGDVTISCLGPGTRGSTFGNVLENDVLQIYRAHHEFVGQFVDRIGLNKAQRDSPLGGLICERHRTCDIRIRPPPTSETPVVKRRVTRLTR